MKHLILGLLVLFTINSAEADKVSVKWYKWFDERRYFVDLVNAQSPLGETNRSFAKRTKQTTINFTYFGKKITSSGTELFPIGDIFYRFRKSFRVRRKKFLFIK